jgi:hypothetical protein
MKKSRPIVAALLGALALILGSAQLSSAQSTSGFIKEFGTMWTFDAPPLDYWEETYGFRPSQDWLDHVRLSSVRIPGCSSSFVSAEGLLMTNHHCARGCISAVSPADTSYQDSGFVANSRADEKMCTGMWADQLQSMEDVTAAIHGAVTASDPQRQTEQRDSAIAAVTQSCNEDTGLNCQVVTLYQGGMYSLYRFKRFTDVRLVMAPEGGAAFFGGDPDNFTYPRYDLDLTLLRVYEDGQPRQTDHYFSWSEAGAEEDELVFITGNPGSTGRLLTLAQMEFLRDVQYPAQLAGYEARLSVLKKVVQRGEAERRQYENQVFGLENSHKAVSGYLSGLVDLERMAKKAAFEEDFRNRITGDTQLQQKYGGAWDAISRAQAELGTLFAQNRYYGFAGSQLLGMAGTLVQLPQQMALPDSARLAAYRGGRLERLQGQLTGETEFDMEMEVMNLAAQLKLAQAALPQDDPFLGVILAGRTPHEAASALLMESRLNTQELRQGLMEGGADAIASCTDPLIVAARDILPLATEVGERTAPLNALIRTNAQLVGQAIFAAYGHDLPPDATFTLRITDGVVKRYPMNGTYAPYKTTFYGLFARSAEFNNESPWALAPRWAAAESRLDLSTPMNFVSTSDIIGGNSGSPVINAQAEVVGLVFDGNIQFLPNRFVFDDYTGRTVSVHSSAIIEALRKVYDAGAIADELQGR